MDECLTGTISAVSKILRRGLFKLVDKETAAFFHLDVILVITALVVPVVAD